MAVAKNPRIKLLPDGPVIEIDGGALYLGRDCHLALQIPALTSKVVSSRHMRIGAENDAWFLEDLGSTNGTWLRKERLTARAALRDGDVFSLGRGGPQWQWECPGAQPAKAAGPADAGATMLEEDKPLDAEKTFLLNQTMDGSGEKPFKVGRTPRIILHHQRTGKDLTGEGYTVVIGRSPGAAQILIRSDEEKHVSGRHAEIVFQAGKAPVVRDLDSSNGTWLNDRRVHSDTPLGVGDKLVLGAAATTLVVKALAR